MWMEHGRVRDEGPAGEVLDRYPGAKPVERTLAIVGSA
jgi:hypothetical protein